MRKVETMRYFVQIDIETKSRFLAAYVFLEQFLIHQLEVAICVLRKFELCYCLMEKEMKLKKQNGKGDEVKKTNQNDSKNRESILVEKIIRD